MIPRSILPILSLAPLIAFPDTSYGQSKIVGGTETPADTYRWIVALADSTGGTLYDRQFCGGSLIAPDWVLTAAHCVEGETASRMQVVVGLTDLDDSSGAEIRGVRGIFIHPSFTDNRGDLFNDVALLLLDSPITTITPVTYARSSGAAPVGTLVRALGWGDTQATPRFPTELRQVDLNISSLTLANRAYGINSLDSRHLAAMASGRDTCSGDSGGPLFDGDGDSGSPLLVGITSYGLDCAVPNVPGIYANVGNYTGLIDSFLAESLTSPPSIKVTGGGADIPDGTRSVSPAKGTNFGRPVRAGRTVTKRFAISNGLGGTPLSITAMGVSNSNFSVSSGPTYLLTGKTATVAVKFRGPSSRRRGLSYGQLIIRSSDPANPTYSFKLLARYVGR